MPYEDSPTASRWDDIDLSFLDPEDHGFWAELKVRGDTERLSIDAIIFGYVHMLEGRAAARRLEKE